MELSEKVLYHQIHPLKLLTDCTTALVSLYLLWQHSLVPGLVVQFVPAIVVSAMMVAFGDLEKQKQSRFGNYIGKYMTKSTQSLRLAGNVQMIVGAWLQMLWLILTGLVVIVLAWLRGLILPRSC